MREVVFTQPLTLYSKREQELLQFSIKIGIESNLTLLGRLGPNACVSLLGQNLFFHSASEEDERDFMAVNVAWWVIIS